ncbi:hypothetical protein CSB69_1591 [Morganella morganii]|nr:hypothetical protein CSB69_1591 [Morganella morganii]EMP53819.1 hypothetical protein C790_00337 [Morganella morganii SC01]
MLFSHFEIVNLWFIALFLNGFHDDIKMVGYVSVPSRNSPTSSF